MNAWDFVDVNTTQGRVDILVFAPEKPIMDNEMNAWDFVDVNTT